MRRASANDADEEQWALLSNRQQLIAELARLGLPTDGSDSALTLRLLRHARTARLSFASVDEGGIGDMEGGGEI